jgi:AraC-like DNA-binding protein
MRLARVRRLIAENLASARLGPELLCRSEGISRASLYRMFEPFGGVAAHILDVRLAYVHRALSDPTDERSISAIAESAGFFDASSLSRAFRRKYQCSPREFRLAALHGLTDAHADPLWPTSPTSLTGLLARL